MTINGIRVELKTVQVSNIKESEVIIMLRTANYVKFNYVHFNMIASVSFK